MGETKPMGFFIDLDIAQLDAVQGDGEKRNEPYKKYGEVSIAANRRSNATIAVSVDSFADRWMGGVDD